MKSQNNRGIWATLIVIGIIAVGALGVAFYRSNTLGASGDINTVAVKYIRGLFAGNQQQWDVDYLGNVTSGGAVLATTSSGTVTLVNTDLFANQTIALTPAVGTVSLTLPTKANIALLPVPYFVPQNGDTVTKYVVNATTTRSGTAGTIKILGNTGVIVRNTATSTAIDSNFIYAGEEARLDFRRSATSTDIYVDISIFHY